jgi:hypothetical protein
VVRRLWRILEKAAGLVPGGFFAIGYGFFRRNTPVAYG